MKNDKLHILIIPSWYPEFEGDYVGSFFREQAIGISRQNCKVGIIYPELKSLRSLKFRFIPRLVRYDDMGLITYKICGVIGSLSYSPYKLLHSNIWGFFYSKDILKKMESLILFIVNLFLTQVFLENIYLINIKYLI